MKLLISVHAKNLLVFKAFLYKTLNMYVMILITDKTESTLKRKINLWGRHWSSVRSHSHWWFFRAAVTLAAGFCLGKGWNWTDWINQFTALCGPFARAPRLRNFGWTNVVITTQQWNIILRYKNKAQCSISLQNNTVKAEHITLSKCPYNDSKNM